MATTIKVYGADWCGDTKMTLAQLKRLDVPFDYIDIEQDPAGEQWVKDQNNGKLKRPTVDVGGRVLVEPSEAELQAALDAAG